tara:strand:- start:50 stop:238 length:189 start_codon:yes stop_codon:yes gene_type:complete
VILISKDLPKKNLNKKKSNKNEIGIRKFQSLIFREKLPKDSLRNIFEKKIKQAPIKSKYLIL